MLGGGDGERITAREQVVDSQMMRMAAVFLLSIRSTDYFDVVLHKLAGQSDQWDALHPDERRRIRERARSLGIEIHEP